MFRQFALVPLIVFASLSCVAQAADEAPHMQIVQGTIEKVEKESLTIKHKASDGTTHFKRSL